MVRTSTALKGQLKSYESPTAAVQIYHETPLSDYLRRAAALSWAKYSDLLREIMVWGYLIWPLSETMNIGSQYAQG